MFRRDVGGTSPCIGKESPMASRFKRGSAPGRARSEDQRPGSFKKGHKKRGGRQRSTPNKFSAEYKKNILEAVYRIGV